MNSKRMGKMNQQIWGEERGAARGGKLKRNKMTKNQNLGCYEKKKSMVAVIKKKKIKIKIKLKIP